MPLDKNIDDDTLMKGTKYMVKNAFRLKNYGTFLIEFWKCRLHVDPITNNLLEKRYMED